MKAKQVSIKEIAARAGTSHSTVSRALRDSPLISEDTRLRIQSLAEEMGYTPNAIAQSLQNKQSNTIGLVVSLIADPYWSGIVEGIEDVALQAGKSLYLNSSLNDPERELRLIETFQRRRVDGILVASSRLGAHYAAWLKQILVPVVMINTQIDGEPNDFCTLSIDHKEGTRQAVDHLVGLGHRKIGFMGVKNRPISNGARLEGYLQGLKDAGIDPEPNWMIVEQFSDDQMAHEKELAEAYTRTLLNTGVTAICCYNDLMAIHVIRTCKGFQMEVPADCSIVGFDDVPPAQYVLPALTTVRQPIHEMGQTAMKMLLDVIDGAAIRNRIFAPKLIIRESTAPPR